LLFFFILGVQRMFILDQNEYDTESQAVGTFERAYHSLTRVDLPYPDEAQTS
jgi:hypothetical protein